MGNSDDANAVLELQRRIGTAASADGRRLLTVKADGAEVHVLDHRFESVHVLTPPKVNGSASASASTSTSAHPNEATQIACVRAVHAHIDDDDRFLVAAASTGTIEIHFWQEPRSTSLFQTKGRTWRPHSVLQLHLPETAGTSESITVFELAVRKLPTPRDESLRQHSLRIREGQEQQRTQLLALIGTTASISLWSLPDTGAAHWRKEWSRQTPAPVVCASLIADASLAAAFVQHDTRAMVWSISEPPLSNPSSAFRSPSRNSGTASMAVSGTESPDLAQSGGAEDKSSRDRPVVTLIDRIQHSRPLTSLEWRKPTEGPASRSDPLLITHTTDGVARIWATVIDQPLQFRLWSSVLPSSSYSPFAPGKNVHDRKGKAPERVFYLGAQESATSLRAHMWELEKELMRAELGVEDFDLPDLAVSSSSTRARVGPDFEAADKKRRRDRERNLRRTRLQRLQQIVSEMPDLFLTFLHDGSLRITALTNVDRSPPTLFQVMTISNEFRFPRARRIVSARFVPLLTPLSMATLSPREDGASRATAELVLVTDAGTELQYRVNPGLLFDGGADGFILKAVGHPRRGRLENQVQQPALLPLCHPQMLRLAIQWGAFDLAREVVHQLADQLRSTDPEDTVELPILPPVAQQYASPPRRKRGAEASIGPSENGGVHNDLFDEALHDVHALSVGRDVASLQEQDIANILSLARVVVRAGEKRKGLDHSGQRFLTSVYLALAASEDASADGGKKKKSVRFCLTGSEAAWAAHSSNQAKLIQELESLNNGRLTWPVASGASLFLWLRGPPETIRQHAKSLARAQYAGSSEDADGDNHDPTRCAMLYYALGKHKLVLSLWRQASWHPDQKKMVQFLSNDFSEPRWQTAALKNAFALMSKRKFELAGAFFLLGGSLRDAVNVCARNLEDVGLAVAVARIAEGDGPVLRSVVLTKLIPLALERGDRGLASLGFGLLGEKVLERRVLVAPSLVDFVGQSGKVRALLGESLSTLEPKADEGIDFEALHLFNHLQSQPDHPSDADLATEAKAAVLRHAHHLQRQGCDLFALRLLLEWTPPAPQIQRDKADESSKTNNGSLGTNGPSHDARRTPAANSSAARPPSPLPAKVNPKLKPPPAIAASDELPSALWDSFGTAPAPLSAGAEAAKPKQAEANEPDGSSSAEGPKKKTGLGTLMKPTSAGQTQQGASEFDMSAFGF
ncbi:hypothetical protein V8E36_002731 [Tilletia maclaganii]